MNIHLEQLIQKTISGELLTVSEAQSILAADCFNLLELVQAAFDIRKRHFGKDILIHILDNVQNGGCSEDCRYCAQSCQSEAGITAYSQKSDQEILEEAQAACAAGAFRHCLVFSGDRLSPQQFEHVVEIVRELKKRFPMEICVSPGFIDDNQAQFLKSAGLDRINHNLNTSRRHYPNICTTHQYDDRLKTITAARKAGLDVCSGLIVGMGETTDDLVEVARELHRLSVASIPVNFFLPIPGTRLPTPSALTPEFCLRVLCLFRFLNPTADIRIAAGREYHLRSLEMLALYPATSLFLDGYLNAKGSSREKTLAMIQDAGFRIRSEHGTKAGGREFGVEDRDSRVEPPEQKDGQELLLKTKNELRTFQRE